MTSPDRSASRPAWPPPAYRPRWGDLPALAWLMARAGHRGRLAPVGTVFAWPVALMVMAMMHRQGHLAHHDRSATVVGRGRAVRARWRDRLGSGALVVASFIALLIAAGVPAAVATLGLRSPSAGSAVIGLLLGPVIIASSLRFRAVAVGWRTIRRPRNLDPSRPTLELANLYGAGTPATGRLCHAILDDAIARGWRILLAPRNPQLERIYRRWGFVPAGGGWMTYESEPTSGSGRESEI
jgi:hypothetical protein